MAKNSYDVSSSRIGSFPTKRKDNSFALCLCTMLVMLVICAMLLLLSLAFKKEVSEKVYNTTGKAFERLRINYTTTEINEISSDTTVTATQDTTQSNKLESMAPQQESTKSSLITETTIQATTIPTIKPWETPPTTTYITEANPISTFEDTTTEKYPDSREIEYGSTENDYHSEVVSTSEKVSTSEVVSTSDDVSTSVVFSTSEALKYTPTSETTTTLREFGEGDTTEKSTINSNDEGETYSLTTTEVNEITEEGAITNKTFLSERLTSDSDFTTSPPSTTVIGFTLEKGTSEPTSQGTTTLRIIDERDTTEKSTINPNDEGETNSPTTTEINEITEEGAITDTTFLFIMQTTPDTTITSTSEIKSTSNTEFKTSEMSTSDSDFTTSPPSTTRIGFTTEKRGTTKLKIINERAFKDTCKFPKCYSAAARIFSSINLSRKPCDDFYEFACGGDILSDKRKENDIFVPEILENEPLNFLKNFSNFYRSCEEYEYPFNYKKRIATLFDILTNDIYGNGNNTHRITELLANLILLEAFPYLDIGIDINPKKSSSFIIVLRKPKYQPLGSTYWSSFSEYRRKCLMKIRGYKKDVSQLNNLYWKCMTDYSDFLTIIQTLREDKNEFLKENKPIQAIKQSVGNLSKSMIQLSESLSRAYSQPSATMKVKELQAKYSILQWKRFFSLISNTDVDEETDILIDKEYFESLMSKLTESEDWINVLESLAEYSIYENIVLSPHVQSRTEFCKEQTKYLMPDIVNYLYKIIPESKTLNENREVIQKLFNRLKEQFIESLKSDDINWIDESTITSMEGMLKKIQLSIFDTEDHEAERDFLNGSYYGILKEDRYPTNLVHLMKHKKQSVLSLQGQDVDSAKIHRYLIDANGKMPLYLFNIKKVYIPYGLLKKASRELPEYLVTAQVGFPLAKIIGKTFTPNRNFTGISVDKRFNDEYSQFMDTSTTFMRTFTFNKMNIFLKDSTLPYVDDKFAENLAMRILTELSATFEDDNSLPLIEHEFSKERLFLLGIAQEFCQKNDVIEVLMDNFENKVLPAPLRIEEILSNSDQFLKDFDCTVWSKMYRSSRMQFPFIQIDLSESVTN